jgi:hypothetical protein
MITTSNQINPKRSRRKGRGSQFTFEDSFIVVDTATGQSVLLFHGYLNVTPSQCGQENRKKMHYFWIASSSSSSSFVGAVCSCDFQNIFSGTKIFFHHTTVGKVSILTIQTYTLFVPSSSFHRLSITMKFSLVALVALVSASAVTAQVACTRSEPCDKVRTTYFLFLSCVSMAEWIVTATANSRLTWIVCSFLVPS